MKIGEMIKELKSFKATFLHAHVILIRNDLPTEEKQLHDAEHYDSISDIPEERKHLEIGEYTANVSLILVGVIK